MRVVNGRCEVQELQFSSLPAAIHYFRTFGVPLDLRDTQHTQHTQHSDLPHCVPRAGVLLTDFVACLEFLSAAQLTQLLLDRTAPVLREPMNLIDFRSPAHDLLPAESNCGAPSSIGVLQRVRVPGDLALTRFRLGSEEPAAPPPPAPPAPAEAPREPVAAEPCQSSRTLLAQPVPSVPSVQSVQPPIESQADSSPCSQVTAFPAFSPQSSVSSVSPVSQRAQQFIASAPTGRALENQYCFL